MKPKIAAIQFCGGCNPRIERGQIARQLQQALTGMGFDVVFNTVEADFVIFLSGCLSGCAFKFNPTTPPYVTIAATTVDSEEVGEARIVQETIRKVKDYYERLETEIRKEDHDSLRGSQAG